MSDIEGVEPGDVAPEAVTAWLCARVPGFVELTRDERTALTDFSLLWSLFECRGLNMDANLPRIQHAIQV